MTTLEIKKHIPEPVLRVTGALKEAGYEAYLVGGCVRDLLLEKEPVDWDVATNALPEDVTELFSHSHYDNDYGTVRVVDDETDDERLKVIEVTTYREEVAYSDNRRPDEVSFSQNLSDDLKRRDFTINAFALDVSRDTKGSISRETVIDEYEGIADLENKRIRTVGDPDERFVEDALRLMRAVRFATQLDFTIEERAWESIEKNAPRISTIAIERVREEFVKILLTGNPSLGIIMLKNAGLLTHFLPELEKTFDVKQNQAHSYDLWEHLLRTLDGAAKKGFPLHVRLAALFHDIGKAPTRAWDENKNDWSFHGHEVVGSRETKKILKKMKFSKDIIDEVTTLVRWHMFFSDPDEITLSAVRRMIKNVGKELIWDLMDLRIADRIGTGRPKEEPYRFRKYQSMVEEALRDPVSVGQLAIDGNDIMSTFHVEPGPVIGHVLHALLEEVLEDPQLNKKESLLEKAKKLLSLPEEDLEKLGKSGEAAKTEKEQEEIKKIREKYWVK